MTDNREVCDLIRKLLGSTCTHVAYHIAKDKYRFAYVKAMSHCYHICSEKESGTDILLMRQKLSTFRATLPKRLKKRWFSSENGFYIMGVEHSMSVVDSIMTRFMLGYSSDDEVFVRNILENVDHGL